jgi:glutaredoxin
MKLAVLSFDPSKKRSVGAKYTLRKVRRAHLPEPTIASEEITTPPATPAPPKPKADVFAKGVHLFTMRGCGRCSWTKQMMDKKGIAYQHYDTDKPNYNSIMWKQLSKGGHKGERITMPVIVVDGKVHYNIKELGNLVEGLEGRGE